MHRQDQTLVSSGKIPLKCLFTIREGEPAYDNIRGVITAATTDIIKIQGGAGGDRTCLFMQQEPVGCAIYADRPAECRVLQCWDTQPLIKMYEQDRLTRKDLLERLTGLWDLVAEHQVRCDYSQIARLAARIKSGQDVQEASEALLAMIRYDKSLRQVTVERTHLDSELLLFLFGRPLVVTLASFQLKISMVGKGLVIQPFGTFHSEKS